MSNIVVRIFSVTTTFHEHNNTDTWTLSIVYDPTDDERKQAFVDEIISINNVTTGPWAICGDFNLILHDQDKNKPRVNRRWMNRFKAALDHNALKEIKLVGRRFTWSNEQADTTLCRLDRAFANFD